jgi:SH3 domain
VDRFESDYSDNPAPSRSDTFKDKPARPTAPKPVFTRKDSLGRDQYIAQFTFEGEQGGDLSFKKGDIIEVTKSSDSRNVGLLKMMNINT